jgi:ABC-type multidrug transport system ATPase subunit
MVAHKLNTVRECDRIYLMRKGRITEEGTYDELMKREGFFFKLVCMNTGTDHSSEFQIDDEDGNDEIDEQQSKRELKRYSTGEKKELYSNVHDQNNKSVNPLSLL